MDMIPTIRLAIVIMAGSLLTACAASYSHIKSDVSADLWKKQKEDCWSVATGGKPKHFPDKKYVFV